MNDELTPKQKMLSELVGAAIGLLLGLLVCLLMGSCKTKESIIHTTDTVRTVAIRHDSIYAHDSVYVREYMRGDTVFVDKYRQAWRYKEKIVTDTLYVSRDNYIRYTVKEKQPWYKSAYLMICTILTLVLLIVLALIWLKSKRNFYLRKNEQEARNT